MSSTRSSVMEKSPVCRSPMPKSPMLKSPMPKSPMPKSPMPKSPELYEKYKSRCAYGLISFFHFRRSHSKKLISNKKCLNSHAIGNGCTMNRVDSLPNCDKKCQFIDDGVDHKLLRVHSGNTGVKRIMGSDAELLGDMPSNDRKANKRGSRRPRRLPIYGCYDVATVGHWKPGNKNLVDRSSKNLDSAITAEALTNQVHPKDGINCSRKSVNCLSYDQPNEINLQVHMNDAAETFVNQKLNDEKHLSRDRASHQSKNFVDALEVLNSNKDLFIKLLQDPNSLLVEHIEDLRDSQTKKQQTRLLIEAEVSEHGRTNEMGYEGPVCTQNFKSCDNLPKGTVESQPIVVFSPGPTSLQDSADGISHDPPEVHYTLRNIRQTVKPEFLSFKLMRKKLMTVMGASRKQEQLMPTDSVVYNSACDFQGIKKQGGRGMEFVGRNSLDIASSNVGGRTISFLDVKRKEQIEEVKKFESGTEEVAASACERNHENSNLSIVTHLKRNTYVENRIHLSGLSNGNANYLRKKTPKTWAGASSIPEYNFLRTVNPTRKRELGFVTPQMRFSPYNNYQIVTENEWSNQIEKKNRCLSSLEHNIDASPGADNGKSCDRLHLLEAKLNIADKLLLDAQVHESVSSLNNDSHCSGFMKIGEVKDNKSSEETNSGVPQKPDGLQNKSAGQSTDTADTCKENGFLDFSRLIASNHHNISFQNSRLVNQTSPSSTVDYSLSPSSIQTVEDIGSIKDRAEQPSPISVLQQFFVEDVTSPLSTESRPTEPSVLPIQIGIEENHLAASFQSLLDLKINSCTSIEEHRFLVSYISAVLKASSFDWNDLKLKCNLSEQLLDQSFFDEVDVWLKQSCSDHRLLFDYVNEILFEVCQYYLRCSPWLSFIRQKIWPATVEENVVNEVMKHVDWNLLLEPAARTLEQLVEKDLSKSGTWLDIQIDAEGIVSEMVESMLEELAIETAIE